MGGVSALLIVFVYVAFAVLVLGLGGKIIQYARTPSPLKIPTTPAPTTRVGVVYRLFRELVFFESLFKATKWTWVFGWLFHFGLLIVLLAHLRYFVNPVWGWVTLVAPLGPYAAMLMFTGLVGLLLRRCFVDRVRYISAPSDYLWLVFLMCIAGSGLLMRYVFHPDIVAVKRFALGLVQLNWSNLPNDLLVLLHVFLVGVLLLIFPFSKLLHVPGLFFSPTRHQVDNPREKQHVTSWAKPINVVASKTVASNTVDSTKISSHK